MRTMRRVRRDASRRAKLNTTLQTTVQVNEVCGAAAYNITLSCGASLACTGLEMMIFQKNTPNYKAAEQQGAITDSHSEVVRHETPEPKLLHTLWLPYDKLVRITMLPLSLIPAHSFPQHRLVVGRVGVATPGAVWLLRSVGGWRKHNLSSSLNSKLSAFKLKSDVGDWFQT